MLRILQKRKAKVLMITLKSMWLLLPISLLTFLATYCWLTSLYLHCPPVVPPKCQSSAALQPYPLSSFLPFSFLDNILNYLFCFTKTRANFDHSSNFPISNPLLRMVLWKLHKQHWEFLEIRRDTYQFLRFWNGCLVFEALLIQLYH